MATTLANRSEVDPLYLFDLYSVDDDGCVFDLATGELLDQKAIDLLRALPSESDNAIPLHAIEELESAVAPLTIESRDDAEYALEKLSRIEGRLLGLKARRDALMKNLDAQIRHEQRKLSWWDWRFGSAVKGFARTLLSGKDRTVRFNFGSVSFRKVNGTPEIIDESGAVEWCKKWNPAVVKVKESVTATNAAKTLEQVRRDLEDPSYSVPFLVFSQDSESVNISTGVE
jgi:hypothetical protein